MKLIRILILASVSGLVFSGCGRSSSGDAAAEKPQLHQNVAPHGGTPVALGEDYNLELVRDGAAGTLSAYVLDDEMEDFIRSSDPSITIAVKVGAEPRTLVLEAVANPATGETVGSTSLFQVEADWLKTTASFTGSIQRVTIRGTPFSDVPFTFPAASTKD